ncbi:MAG TPA: PTS sugar transporter subunit IIA [Thermoanaerobaculia bacterium]|nr:PTS sugar transporter subunit IIA [Thermoanaerobaculia bacterium]
MNLASLTEPELVFPDLPGDDVSSVLHSLARRVAELGYVTDSDHLHAKLIEREQLGSTGIGSGVAIPHCKMAGLSRAVLAVAQTRRPVDFGAVDGQPVRLFFLVISPADSPAVHLQVLSSISRWVKADHHVERLLGTRDRAAIYEMLKREGR